MISRKFIRLGIPPLLILVALTCAMIAHFVILRQRESRRNVEVLDRADRQAAWLAGLAVKSGTENTAPLQVQLAYLAEDSDLKYAVVCDSRRHILAATREEWVSRSLLSTAAEDSAELVRMAQKTREPQGRIILGQDIVIVAHPLTIGSDSGDPFVTVIERDLSNAQELARKGARQDLIVIALALLVVGAVSWAAFHWLLARQDRHRLDAELRQSRIAESLNAALLTARGDRIESLNPAGLQLLGMRSDAQVLGRSPFDFFHSDSQQTARDLMRAVTQHGSTPPPIEGRIVRADGTPVDVKISALAVSLEEGDAVQLVLTDITEQRQRESSRAALSRDLEEKNRELEAIVYAASHDLRSPLLNVMGFSRQLDDACRQLAPLLPEANGAGREQLDTILGTTVPRALRFIEQGVTRMDSLLSGFLRYSRVGRQEIVPQRLDMNAMLKGIASNLTFLMQQSDAGLRVEDLPPCMGDAMQINQVFSNLLDNALKYRKRSVPCVIHLSGSTEGAEAVYSVTDNGSGIAPEHLRVIFEIFHRLNPAESAGEGLGLTIAQRIVQRHNGSIAVVSQPGVGSTFTVRLPLAP